MDHPFRSAAVGGFNRQDVLSFLEEQSKQAAQAQKQLQDQLDEANRQVEALRQERDGLSGTLDETQRQLETACQTRNSLELLLKQTEQDLADCRAGAEQTTRALERVRQERDEAKARLETLSAFSQTMPSKIHLLNNTHYTLVLMLCQGSVSKNVGRKKWHRLPLLGSKRGIDPGPVYFPLPEKGKLTPGPGSPVAAMADRVHPQRIRTGTAPAYLTK